MVRCDVKTLNRFTRELAMRDISPKNTVSFTRMDDGTAQDYALLKKLEKAYISTLPERILSTLENLEDTLGGYQVTRLEHSLQTATRAQEDGADKIGRAHV